MAASVLEVTILRANLWSVGFRPVPIYNVEAGGPSPGKRPLGAQWQIDARADPPFCATHPAVPHATNTGILCDGLRAIDLDIDDRGKAKACSTLLVKMLGKAPARWRNNSPRVLALYRAAEGEPAKLSLTGRGHTKDCACKIEVLGRGQQFVAFGMHESGAALEWLPTQPGQEEYEDLTPVTEEQVLDFLTEAAKIIDAPPPALFGKGPVLFGRGPALNGANGHDTSVTTILLNPRRAMFEQIKASNGGWHDLTRDWVAKMIARGYEAWAIEAMAASLTRPGYTVEQTLAEVRVMIEGAVGKGYAPDESPIIDVPQTQPLLDAETFMATFTNPDYLIEGVIQRGRVHALTSLTGHGKTAAALYLACMIATGRSIGSIEVVQGNVVFLAGENPDDLCGRFHAACQFYQIKSPDLPIRILPGNFHLTAQASETLKQTIDEAGYDTALIVADSAAAYFPGDDENHNVQMGEFARNLRILTGCRGNPAVIVLSHPTKAAAKDNLLPRGGGAFLNEIDANLTMWSEAQGEVSTLHWQGKIRGADFQPMNLTLRQVRLDELKDARGRPYVSIIATIQTDDQAEKAVKQSLTDENTVLEHLRRAPGISIGNIASNIGWLNTRGEPNKSKVQKLLRSLLSNKLAKPWRGKWRITEAGEKELEEGHIK